MNIRLTVLIPTLIVATAVTDTALRLAPFDWFTFRAWEAMAHLARPPAPFEANKTYDRRRTYGDIAAMGNLPSYRQYRRERFTTDALGLRNPPDWLTSGADAILMGDSYSAGSGVSDSETLSAQLKILSGRKVYTVAPMRLDPDGIIELSERLKMTRGLVLYQHLSRFTPPSAGSQLPRPSESATPSLQQRVETILTPPRSPMQILADRMAKYVENGRIRPNPFAPSVEVHALRNGDPMLFTSKDVLEFRLNWPSLADSSLAAIDESVAAYRWYATRLRARQLDFLVVLVPDKFTVYRGLLEGEEPAAPYPSLYLEVLERRLRAAGVSVLNLSDILIARAATELAQGHYLYWRDDTHWNAAGIRLAAATIAQHESWVSAGSAQ